MSEIIEGFDVSIMNDTSKATYRAFSKAMNVYREHEAMPVQSHDRMNRTELCLFLFMAGMKYMDGTKP